MANPAGKSSGEVPRLDIGRRLMVQVRKPVVTSRERYVLTNKFGIARRATRQWQRFGMPEHHADNSALRTLVQSGNLSLEIRTSG